MIQTQGKKKRYVLADINRKRVCVRRQYMRVGQDVQICYQNKMYKGVVEEKAPGGFVLAKYKKYKGQSQAYKSGEWKSYMVTEGECEELAH